MEKWRRVWRVGIAPALPKAGLLALREALLADDPRLIQGWIAIPLPFELLRDCRAQAACAIGYCGLRANHLHTVGEVEQFFHRICDAADATFNEPASCRHFLKWFDDTSRDVMRRELLNELALLLDQPSAAA